MDTTQQIISGTRLLLRRPSDIELADEDMREVLNGLVAGWIQDLQLSPKEQRTDTKEVQIVQDGTDYLLIMADVPDFEPMRLEYSARDANGFSGGSSQASLVPLASYAQHFAKGGTIASIYSSIYAGTGQVKIRINHGPDTVAGRVWRLTYRVPMLTVLQMSAPLPLPSNFSRMVKLRLALACAPIVDNESDKWKGWCSRFLPMYVGEIRSEWSNEEKSGRWDLYLSRSLENPIQPVEPYNSFRSGFGVGRRMRGYLEVVEPG